MFRGDIAEKSAAGGKVKKNEDIKGVVGNYDNDAQLLPLKRKPTSLRILQTSHPFVKNQGGMCLRRLLT